MCQCYSFTVYKIAFFTSIFMFSLGLLWKTIIEKLQKQWYCWNHIAPQPQTFNWVKENLKYYNWLQASNTIKRFHNSGA